MKKTQDIEKRILNSFVKRLDKKDSPCKNLTYPFKLHLINLVSDALGQMAEEAVKERDIQILSWYKLPIKEQDKEKIGPIKCDVCSGSLYFVRGRYPKDSSRIICPDCTIETLEDIYSNLFPNNQAQEAKDKRRLFLGEEK